MAITLEIITERKGEYESKVRMILKGLTIKNPLLGETSIYDAHRIFIQELKQIPRKSAFYAEYCYKAGDVENKQFIVYHLNCKGDIDRTVAIVKQA